MAAVTSLVSHCPLESYHAGENVPHRSRQAADSTPQLCSSFASGECLPQLRPLRLRMRQRLLGRNALSSDQGLRFSWAADHAVPARQGLSSRPARCHGLSGASCQPVPRLAAALLQRGLESARCLEGRSGSWLASSRQIGCPELAGSPGSQSGHKMLWSVGRGSASCRWDRYRQRALWEKISAAVTSAVEKAKEAQKDLIEGELIAGNPFFDDEDVTVLARIPTAYNYIQVIELARRADHHLAGARVLLLDKPGNIHSVYWPYKVWTDSYYDLVAMLPPLIPDGPVAILGLAAGTAARILNDVWPEIDMHGWEIDPDVIHVARQHFDLGDLEDPEGAAAKSQTLSGPIDTLERDGPEDSEEEEEQQEQQQQQQEQAQPEASGLRQLAGQPAGGVYRSYKGGVDVESQLLFRPIARSGSGAGESGDPVGRLRVHVGDALGEDVGVDGGFAGIFVDLFAGGAVIAPLQEADTWRRLKRQLRPGGRIMVNCGGACVEGDQAITKDGEAIMEETLQALESVFPGELLCRRIGGGDGNVMALTGLPPADWDAWRRALPEFLRDNLELWTPHDGIGFDDFYGATDGLAEEEAEERC